MQFSQIHHCSMAVQDLDRAAVFYRDILGLTEIAIPPTFQPAGLNVRWFRLGSQQIHLLLEVQTHPPSQRHMALQVDDAQTARLWMKEKGINIEETVLIPGADRFFITDPDGNQVEIIEWKDAYLTIDI
ncbi:MAG: VOC family protein [Anaerolineales bacterium]|nr:VOC family protein [Anaerolineales bacterium]